MDDLTNLTELTCAIAAPRPKLRLSARIFHIFNIIYYTQYVQYVRAKANRTRTPGLKHQIHHPSTSNLVRGLCSNCVISGQRLADAVQLQDRSQRHIGPALLLAAPPTVRAARGTSDMRELTT